jgi:hypothetical protein
LKRQHPSTTRVFSDRRKLMLWRLTFHEAWKLSSSIKTTRVKSVCPLSLSSLSEMSVTNAWRSVQSRLRASKIWILHACKRKRVRSTLQAFYVKFMAALTNRFPRTGHKWYSYQFRILRNWAVSLKFLRQSHIESLPSSDLKLFPWKITLSLKVWIALNKARNTVSFLLGCQHFYFRWMK